MSWGSKFHVVIHGRDGIQSFPMQVPLILDTYGVGLGGDVS